jgi:hypothetical protein
MSDSKPTKSLSQQRREAASKPETGDTLNGASGPTESAHTHSDNVPAPKEQPNQESEKK